MPKYIIKEGMLDLAKFIINLNDIDNDPWDHKSIGMIANQISQLI